MVNITNRRSSNVGSDSRPFSGRSSKNQIRVDCSNEKKVENALMFLDRNPTSRDGHAAVVLFNSLVIFGGDRHRMSFNDLLILPLIHHL